MKTDKMESNKCKVRLECGHQCPLDVHPNVDPEHENVRCEKPCPNTLCTAYPKHMCKFLCYEGCQPCTVLVTKRFRCGHAQKVCCKDATGIVVCTQKIVVEVPCGHKATVTCGYNLTQYVCMKKCKKVIPICGHPCQKLCKDKCGKCEIIVGKTRRCGCKFDVKCHDDPQRIVCNKCDWTVNFFLDKLIALLLLLGKIFFSIISIIMLSEYWMLKIDFLLLIFSVCFLMMCYIFLQWSLVFLRRLKWKRNTPLQSLKQNKPVMQPLCLKLLPCGHVCQGRYWACHEGRVHEPCSEQCGRIKVCGHACNIPCAQDCPPCERDCPNTCEHSQCSLKCEIPCKPCLEPCPWQCIHYKCNLHCWEFCSRPRCDIPCMRKIHCGHQCVGLCGEKCPSLCRQCDSVQLGEILFGDEEEENARFIQLDDCGHCVEVNGMDKWMDETDGEIKMKRCPRCSAIIWRSRRYGNIVRRCIADVEKVKIKVLGGTTSERKHRMTGLLSKVWDMTRRSAFQQELSSIQNELSDTRPSSVLGNGRLAVIENQLNMLALMTDTKLKASKLKTSAGNYLLAGVNKLSARLMKNKESITEFEIQHISREMKRMCLFAAAIDVEERLTSTASLTSQKTELLKNINELFKSGHVLTNLDETTVERMLKECKIPLGITSQEIAMVVRATNLAQGHWYKCPNGHVYAIGECGRPMEKGQCPECKATIGGQSHTLESRNSPVRFWFQRMLQ